VSKPEIQELKLRAKVFLSNILFKKNIGRSLRLQTSLQTK